MKRKYFRSNFPEMFSGKMILFEDLEMWYFLVHTFLFLRNGMQSIALKTASANAANAEVRNRQMI